MATSHPAPAASPAPSAIAPARPLPVGGAATVAVVARTFWNHTGILLEAGAVYDLVAEGRWIDWTIATGPDGYATSDAPWYSRLTLWLFERGRRMPRENWFALIGAVGQDDPAPVRIGSARRGWTPARSGELLCFANDHPRAYGNNKQEVRLTVTRRA